MKKLSLTILHRLPNRIRFKVYPRIRNFKVFEEFLNVDNNMEIRYNTKINTLLVKFDPKKIYLQEVIYKVVTALSIQHGMMPVKLIEDYEEKSIDSLSLYSGAAISLSLLHNLIKKNTGNLQTNINHFTAILTTGAIVEHAYRETKQKGFFDIEILPALYLLKSYLNSNSIYSLLLMWLTTFGRHLILNNVSNKEIRVFRIKDENGKYQYIADIREDNSIGSISDLVYRIFFNNIRSNRSDEKYITLQ